MDTQDDTNMRTGGQTDGLKYDKKKNNNDDDCTMIILMKMMMMVMWIITQTQGKVNLVHKIKFKHHVLKQTGFSHSQDFSFF